jgi:hypothetical protein
VSGGGSAAFFDPTPLNPGSGDEVVLVGTGTANATTVDRDVWDPATGTFDPLDAIDIAMPRVQGVSIGSSGDAYVIAVRDSTVKRIDNITAGNATPTVETVGHSAGVRGAAAIAVGKDAANNATVYLAENVGGGISALHPGNASSVATATNLGNAGEAFGGWLGREHRRPLRRLGEPRDRRPADRHDRELPDPPGGPAGRRGRDRARRRRRARREARRDAAGRGRPVR